MKKINKNELCLIDDLMKKLKYSSFTGKSLNKYFSFRLSMGKEMEKY